MHDTRQRYDKRINWINIVAHVGLPYATSFDHETLKDFLSKNKTARIEQAKNNAQVSPTYSSKSNMHQEKTESKAS